MRVQNGESRNTKLRRKYAGRGNALPRAQTAIENCCSICVIDLPVQRLWRLPVHDNYWEDSGRYSLHFGGS
jgi:hypothetical protein